MGTSIYQTYSAVDLQPGEASASPGLLRWRCEKVAPSTGSGDIARLDTSLRVPLLYRPCNLPVQYPSQRLSLCDLVDCARLNAVWVHYVDAFVSA